MQCKAITYCDEITLLVVTLFDVDFDTFHSV